MIAWKAEWDIGYWCYCLIISLTAAKAFGEPCTIIFGGGEKPQIDLGEKA